MACLHLDSFDDRTVDPDDNTFGKYDYVSATVNGTVKISAGNGRNGTASMRIVGGTGSTLSTGYVQKRLGNASGQTFIGGHSYKTNVLPSTAYPFSYAIMDNATVQFWLRLNTDGTISAMSGTTVLGTSSATIAINTEYYFSLKVVIDTTTGTVDLDIYTAGTPTTFLTLTGKNTAASAVEEWNGFRLGWNHANTNGTTTINTSTFDFDDVYIFDGSGSINNDRVGDKRVAARAMQSDYSTQFTRSTGSDSFANVDDSTPDGDSTYNHSTTDDHVDLFNVFNLPTQPTTVYAYQGVIWCKHNNPAHTKVAMVMRDNVTGTVYAETAQYVSADYWGFLFPRDTDPATSARITESAANANQFGYKRPA